MKDTVKYIFYLKCAMHVLIVERGREGTGVTVPMHRIVTCHVL